MRNVLGILSVALGFVLIGCSTNYIKEEGMDCDTVSFASHVFPVYQTRCNNSGCHGINSKNGDFTSYESIVEVSKGDFNRHLFSIKDMPPEGATQLTNYEKAILQCWFDADRPKN